MEWSFIWENMIDMTNVQILGSLHGISFLDYPQTILQELQMYTNRHNHQHTIK